MNTTQSNKHPSIDNQPKWREAILSTHPAAIFENNGTYIYATVNGYDVGFYSIVGNYGKVFDKPLDDISAITPIGD